MSGVEYRSRAKIDGKSFIILWNLRESWVFLVSFPASLWSQSAIQVTSGEIFAAHSPRRLALEKTLKISGKMLFSISVNNYQKVWNRKETNLKLHNW